MILIIGLGNPGRKYQKTRHNVGFMVIDALEKSLDDARDKKIILFKPQVFMNQSGKAVKSLVNRCSLNAKPYTLIVIHDDIDLPFGTIRISKNVSSAGHKGIESIINELKTKNFARFRIGIRPLLRQGYGGQAEKFVLQKFKKEEKKIVKKVIEKVIELIKENLEGEIKNTTVKISQ